jgi:hypothetical protein
MPENADPQAPQISADYADYVTRTAAQIERDYPNNTAMLEHAAGLRRSIEGLAPPPVTEGRSNAQIWHDRMYGIETHRAGDYDIELPRGYEPAEGTSAAQVIAGAQEFCAALQAPPALGRALVADMLSNEEPDPEQVAQALERIGRNYADDIKAASAALSRTGVKATKLSAWSLAQLAIHGAHAQRHQQSRPKS